MSEISSHEPVSSDDVIKKIEAFNIPEGHGFSEAEKEIIDAMFAKVSDEEGKKEVRAYISEHLTGDAKESLSFLRKEVESASETETSVETANNETFSGLQEEVGSKNEIMKKLFNISDQYFDARLDALKIEGSEKENVKLVLWDKLMQNFDIKAAMGSITLQIKGKVKELFNLSKVDKELNTIDEIDVEKIVKGLTKIEQDLEWNKTEASKLYGGVDALLGKSFEKIKLAKEKGEKLDSVQTISSIIDGEEKAKTYEDIKKSTLEKLKSVEKIQEKGNALIELLNGLPKEWQEKIGSYIKEIAKNSPILGFFISLFLGKGFLEGQEVVDNKAQQSINNLIRLVQETEEDNNVKKLNPEELSKLTPEKLKDFFKYLNKNNIDYTGSNFWTEILTGGSKNEKINQVHNLLKSEGTVIETSGDNITTNFINKLNNIEKLEQKDIADKALSTKEKQDELEQQQKDARKTEDEIKKSLNDPTLSVTEKETKEAELTKVREENKAREIEIAKAKEEARKAEEANNELILAKQQEQELKESILAITNLPKDVIYKGKPVELKIVDNNIMLGDNKYKISINHGIIGNVFRGVEFKDGKLQIEYKNSFFGNSTEIKEIAAKETIDTISALLNIQEYQEQIASNDKKPKNKDVTLKIEKIA